MKKLIESRTCAWLIACLLYATVSQAQHFAPVLADAPILTTGLQLSSAGIVDDQLYAIEEKFHRILIIDPKTLRIVLEDPGFSEKIGKKPEIEALSVYRNHRLLITDEANASILRYDMTSGSLSPVKVNGINISADKGEMGIEGIAIEGDSVCYLLKERDGEYRSQIRVFKIKERNGRTELDYTGTNMLIQHPNQRGTSLNHHWRYSDLYFEQGKLYAIRSLFVEKRSDSNRYIIDTVNVSKYREPKKYQIEDNTLGYWDISAIINQYRGSHSTNLEGISVRKNKIYLVSDNVYGESIPKKSDYEKTMIIAIERP